jgi:hypothetical protein
MFAAAGGVSLGSYRFVKASRTDRMLLHSYLYRLMSVLKKLPLQDAST